MPFESFERRLDSVASKSVHSVDFQIIWTSNQLLEVT